MKRNTPLFGGIRPTPMERARGRLMRAPDHNSGTGGGGSSEGGDDDAAKAAKEAADAAAEVARKAAESATGGDDEVKAENERLRQDAENARREAEEARAEAARYKGIDPEKAKADAKKVAEAEAAQREAEKKQAEAEGNFEKLREIQNQEFEDRIKAVEAERDAERAKNEATTARLANTQLKAEFAGSNYFKNETILTPTQAQRLYGDYVEVEDEQTVVYDAPRGAAKRTKVMDSKGNPLPFNAAIQKVVEADPDKNTVIKSKTTPGAGSKTDDGKPEPKRGDRLSRLAGAIGELRK